MGIDKGSCTLMGGKFLKTIKVDEIVWVCGCMSVRACVGM